MMVDFDVTRLRKRFALIDRMAGAPRDVSIEAMALSNCVAEWIRPANCSSDRVILYFPGGAWSLRMPRTHRNLVARLSRAANANSLLVFYRLAPEHPFPAGADDCLEAYQHLLAEGISPSRIVVGGDSAGGNLCLALLLTLRDRGLPMPAGAFALSPCTELNDVALPSRISNKDLDPLIPAIRSTGAGDARMMYVAGRAELLLDPYVSPLRGDLHGLCPLLLQTGSTEILRDDSVEFVSKARAAGVSAEVEVWEGLSHVWHSAPMPESSQAFGHLADFIRSRCP